MFEFDFSKLRGRIKEKLGNESKFAEKIYISTASLSAKLNNKIDFTASEIIKACSEEVLDIPLNEISLYFFTRKLELNSSK